MTCLFLALPLIHIVIVSKKILWLNVHVLKAQGSIYIFAITKVKYLGHIVEKGTSAMDPKKIHTIVAWLVPISVKKL